MSTIINRVENHLRGRYTNHWNQCQLSPTEYKTISEADTPITGINVNYHQQSRKPSQRQIHQSLESMSTIINRVENHLRGRYTNHWNQCQLSSTE